MDAFASELYKELDPNKKDYAWANHEISILRRDWRSIVNRIRAAENKSILFSRQSMELIRNSFEDKDFKKQTNFRPLPLYENILNALIEEITKLNPRPEAKATDPAAINLKKKDLMLLRNRKMLEGEISTYQNQIGLPQYKLDYKNFKGNVEEFDKMGLDEDEPEDLGFYEQNYQRLNFEVAAQTVLDNVMKLNRFDESAIRKFVIDILSVKTICAQAYVDQITGEIKYKYLYPETCYGSFGDTNDGHDDICKGWQDIVTVREWLQMVGDDFEWDKHWRQLLWAINFGGNYKYTGFVRNNQAYECFGNEAWMNEGNLSDVTSSNLLDFTLAYKYKVHVGYIEWWTMDATSSYLRKMDDPKFAEPVPFNYTLKEKKQLKGYKKESYYQQQWYKAYFIVTTAISQWIYGFGKVYYQQLHGANDEYSNGTLKYYRVEGYSAVELTKQYVDMANFAFYKLLWTIYKAKPEEDVFFIEELIQVAKGLQQRFPQMGGTNTAPNFQNILEQTIQIQREKSIRLRSFPQVDGRTIGQPAPLEGKRNGIDPISAAMQAVVTWAEAQIAAKIGFNPSRLGANPPARESFESENAVLNASYNTTGYVYRMIEYVQNYLAETTLLYALDIVKFKESQPNKWLKKLIGDDDYEELKLLMDEEDSYSPHRFGIFIEGYNSNVDKQEIKQAATLALQQRTITYDQWFVITQTEDYKKASKLLSHLLRKAEKKRQEQELQALQLQQQAEQAKDERQLQMIQMQGQIDIQKAQLQLQAAQYTADRNYDKTIDSNQLRIQNEPNKQAVKTEAQKDLAATKENLKEQKPYESL